MLGTDHGSVAANTTHLFYAVGHAVFRVTPDGGPIEQLPSVGPLQQFAVDDTTLYWPWKDVLYATPLAGGEVTALATGRGISMLAVDAQHVYWLNGGTMETGEIGAGVMRVAKTGGEALPLYCYGYGDRPDTARATWPLAAEGAWLLAPVAKDLLALPK